MSRIESLENRLREVTLEYGRLLRAELAAIADGGSSTYLLRKTSPHVIDGRYWSTETTDKLDRLEAEIRSLGDKLADPDSEQLLGILDDFSQQVAATTDRTTGGLTRIARQFLRAMGDRWHAT